MRSVEEILREIRALQSELLRVKSEEESAVSRSHSILRETLHEVVGFDRAGSLVGHPYEQTYHVIAQHAEQAFAALDELEEQFDSLREAAARTLHEYDLWAEDANDGEFAIWSRDEFMASFVGLRNALIWAGAASSPASEPNQENRPDGAT